MLTKVQSDKRLVKDIYVYEEKAECAYIEGRKGYSVMVTYVNRHRLSYQVLHLTKKEPEFCFDRFILLLRYADKLV